MRRENANGGKFIRDARQKRRRRGVSRCISASLPEVLEPLVPSDGTASVVNRALTFTKHRTTDNRFVLRAVTVRLSSYVSKLMLTVVESWPTDACAFVHSLTRNSYLLRGHLFSRKRRLGALREKRSRVSSGYATSRALLPSSQVYRI